MRIKTDIPFSVNEISTLMKNAAFFEDALIDSITTDSRECGERDLFIALRGERTDGHIFTNEALSKGAYVLGESDSATIKVKSTYDALLKIALAYREKLTPKYTIGITGSVGKTTTKEFLYSMLSEKYKTHKTFENFNNSLGLSYTLLSARRESEALVCELGMNHFGEIAKLSRVLMPNIAIITNIGSAHIGNLGSKENIAKAKLEIIEGLKNGKLIIDKDEPLLRDASNAYFISKKDASADLFIKKIIDETSGCSVIVKTKSFEKLFKTPLFAKHHIDLLCLCIGACELCGMDENEIEKSINRIDPKNLRQRTIVCGGYIIYDDSYNSSPEAVNATLDMLTEKNESVSALLGDMLELNDQSEILHYEIGKKAAYVGLKRLFTFGRYAKNIAYGAIDHGMKKSDVFINTDEHNHKASADAIASVYEGEMLLIKASHSLRADKIIEILLNKKRE